MARSAIFNRLGDIAAGNLFRYFGLSTTIASFDTLRLRQSVPSTPAVGPI